MLNPPTKIHRQAKIYELQSYFQSFFIGTELLICQLCPRFDIVCVQIFLIKLHIFVVAVVLFD